MRAPLALGLVVSLAAPELLTAQQSTTDVWSEVRQLPAGQVIRVVLADDTRQGQLRSADETSVTIIVAGLDERVPRADIRRILAANGTHRKRNVLLGLAIGGVTAGVVVGLRCRGQNPGCNEVAPAYFYPLAGVGAGIGALLPAQAWQQVYP